MRDDGRPVSRTAKALAVALALLAPARMAWIVFTVGENNLSNDYVGRIGVVAAILEGRYDFRRLFTDTFITYGHSWLGLLPFYWFDARFFAWSMNAELGIGLVLAGTKTVLVWFAVAPSLSEKRRWVLLPALSTLAFSVSQVTSFTFGESTLQMQLPQVGLALGVLAVARFSSHPNRRILFAAFGGLLAALSWGGGVMVWPVFVVALFALGERSLLRWCVLGLAAALGISQYVWFLVVQRVPSPIERPGFTQPWRYIDLIGRPFSNDTGWHLGPLVAAASFGAAGLALAAVALWSSRHALRERLPSLMILAWSLLAALEIGFFRRDAAPWYIVPMTAFWLGLSCLLAAAPRSLAHAGLATIAAGLLFSNRTWEDKSFYLSSRSPASAACLREWRTSPEACHDLLFEWRGKNLGEAVGLGEPLDRLHLSVFSDRRTYLLQGDLAIGRAAVETPRLAVFFSRDDVKPADPKDFHRLDAVFAPGAAVTWRIDLPPSLRSAEFRTRVHAAPGDVSLARGASVAIVGEGGEARILVPAGGRKSLSMNLNAFAGRGLTLRIAAEEATGGAPLVFEAPRVELEGVRRTIGPQP